MNKEISLTRPFAGVAVAFVLWTIMFSPWTAPYVNFWAMMTFSGVVLGLFTCWARPRWWKEVSFSALDLLAGVVLAAFLWLVFYIGEYLSTMLFDFARPQVDSIYGMKSGENPVVLTLLMLFIIGPAEEIFWRGCIQNRFSERWSPGVGFIVTTIVYALVHITRFNFMLIMAAMVAGFVWGLAYRFFPERLGAIIISHALWDCAVFIWFPIM